MSNFPPFNTRVAAKILIADDQPSNLELLGNCLQDTGYHILVAEDGVSCLQIAEQEQPHLILLDIMMPEMDGFEVCQTLKAQPHMADTPIIFLTGLSNIDSKIKGFRLGAADYINKPFQIEEVLARVNTQVHLCLMRQQLEQQNQLLQAQAQQAQLASQAKSRFMAMSSHDLRQPLHALSLLLETLGSKLDNRHLSVLIQRIRQSINALSNLFNTLLDMSQLDAEKIQVHIEPLDLNQLADQLCEEFAEKAQDKGLSLHFADCPQPIYSDPSLLKRILQNLIANAIRYTSQGQVSMDYQIQDECLFIRVKDTGVGIATAQQSLIFEEFYRIDTAGNGLGMGLNIVKRLADLLQHPLSLDTQVGQGSCFSLSVPCAEMGIDTDFDDNAEPFSTGLCVGLIDDDPVTLEITQELLEDWGYDVLATSSPHHLLDHLSVPNASPIDVLLTDFQLQDMNGLTLIEHINAVQKHPLAALFITAETALYAVKEMQNSAIQVLIKPVSPEDLFDALQNLVKAEL